MKEFTNLHVHTTYSFLDGYGTPAQYIKQLKGMNQNKIGITDHGATWGHIPFYFELKKEGIKTILGCEFYYALDIEEKKRSNYHLTVLAQTNKGLHNLYKLLTAANHHGFYYKPRIDNDLLFAHQEGLVVLSGCMGTGFPITHVDTDPELTAEWINLMKRKIQQFYIEVSPFRERISQAKKIIEIANVCDVPIALTSDAHFPAPSNYKAQDMMLAIGMKVDYHSATRMRLWDHLHLLETDKAHKLAFELFGIDGEKYIDQTNEIADICDVVFEKAKCLSFPKKNNESAAGIFESWIQKGIEFRGIKSKEYLDRITYEVEIISKKNYIDYFLIIADLCQWAKQRMLVGAARGSVAGSLVAYVLRITEVDPIKHELMFERFIDLYRTDPPDIDLDFPHKRRGEIYQYLDQKYGSSHVALLGTIAYFKGKNSIWDVGRIFNIPRANVTNLAKNIIERSSGDSRADFCIEDSISEVAIVKKEMDDHPEFKFATQLEGQARQPGVHAAAIIISDNELKQYGSFLKHEDKHLLSMDKKYAEKLNLLKIDVLGLKQLTVIENTLKLINKTPEWLYSIPLDDVKAFKLLNDHLFAGIFQFEGAALKAVSRQSRPDNFDSMHEISALARPGTLHSGMTTKYLNRRAWIKKFDRKTKEPPEYFHKSLESITKETLGIVIYQEQVIKIMREVGDMSWAETKEIRLLISKSKGVEFFNKFLDIFRKGARKKGMSEYQIDELWNSICTFGSWAFNKSHSVSYGYISYWTLYLKSNYPAEFFISAIREEKDEDSIKFALREWVKYFDGKLVILDGAKSGENYELQNRTIYGGFSSIKGIGEKQAARIIAARNAVNSLPQFKKAIGAKNYSILKQLSALPAKFKTEQLNLFPSSAKTEDSAPPINAMCEFAPWANLFPIGNEYQNYYDEKNFKHISEVDDNTTIIRLIGQIKIINLRSINETTTQKKAEREHRTYRNAHIDKFFNIVIEDDTGSMFVNVTRYNYDKFKEQIWGAKVGGIIALEGRKLPGFMLVQIDRLQVLKNAGSE